MYRLHRLKIKMAELLFHLGQIGVKAGGISAQIDKNNVIPDGASNRDQAG